MSEILDLLKNKIEGLIDEIEDKEILNSEPLLAARIKELYKDYKEKTNREYTDAEFPITNYWIDLKKRNELQVFLSNFSEDNKNYAKDLWNKKNFKQLVPAVVRELNRLLLADEKVKKIDLQNILLSELPQGHVKVSPVSFEIDKGKILNSFDRLRDIITEIVPVDKLRDGEKDKYLYYTFSKNLLSFSNISEKQLINLPVDMFEWADSGNAGRLNNKQVDFSDYDYAENVIKDIDIVYLKSVQDARKYVFNKSNFTHYFTELESFPIINNIGKAAYFNFSIGVNEDGEGSGNAYENTAGVDNMDSGIVYELVFDRINKVVAPVPAQRLLNALYVLFSVSPKGKLDFYYDSLNCKLVISVPQPAGTLEENIPFAVLDCQAAGSKTFATLPLDLFVSGLTVREKEKLIRTGVEKMLEIPSDLITRRPYINEYIGQKSNFRSLAAENKEIFWQVLIDYINKYISSYTNIKKDKSTGVEIREVVLTEKNKNNKGYVYEVEELFWQYNTSIEIEELLSFFVARGRNDYYQLLCLKILGVDYYDFFDALVDIFLERRLLAVESLKVNYATQALVPNSLKYEYVHKYASGNIYRKKLELNGREQKDEDSGKVKIVGGQTDDIYAYFGYDTGMRIISAQNEILDDKIPTPCTILSSDPNKKLEIGINNEIFWKEMADGIITKTSTRVGSIHDYFADYLVKAEKLGGLSKPEIMDGYVYPIQKGAFIIEYILPNWKEDGKPAPVKIGYKKLMTGETKSLAFTILNLAKFMFAKQYSGKDMEDIKKIEDFKPEERLKAKALYEAVIAAYNEKISRITVEGNRLFNLFLKTVVTEGTQQAIAKFWNERHNNYAAPSINKTPIFIRHSRYFGKDKLFRLKKSQVEGVRYSASRENAALLAHDVGFGKTTCSLSVISHWIETGEANRILVSTPKRVFPKFVKEAKGADGERGIVPHINLIELSNAKANVFISQKGAKGNILKKGLKDFTDEELVAMAAFKKFKPDYDKMVFKLPNRRLELTNVDANKVVDLLEKHMPDYDNFKALQAFVRDVHSFLGIYQRRVDDKIDIEKKKGRPLKPEQEKALRIKSSREFTKEVTILIAVKERSLIDEFGVYTQEALAPRSIVLASHVALEELKPSEQGTRNAVSFIDDVYDSGNARVGVSKWINILQRNPITFSKLNIDAIVVDEVHNFNELLSQTRRRYISEKGDARRGRKQKSYNKSVGDFRGTEDQSILMFSYKSPSTTGRDKINLFSLVEDVVEKNKNEKLANYRNTIMLSGTPFTEGPFHMLSVMALTNRQLLGELQMESAYKFFENYVNEEWKFDVTADGRYGLFAKIDSYRNNAALCNFMNAFVDFKVSDDEINALRPVKYTLPDDVGTRQRLGGITSYVPLNTYQEKAKESISEFLSGKRTKEEVCSVMAPVEKVSTPISTGMDDEEVEEKVGAEEELEEKTELDAELLVSSGTLTKDQTNMARAIMAKGFQEKMVISPYLLGCSTGDLKLPPLEGETESWEGKKVSIAPKNFVENSPKILYCIECIKSVLEYHRSVRQDDLPSSQIIYLNMGKNFEFDGTRGYDAYSMILQYIANFRPDIGLSFAEMGVIHGGITDEVAIRQTQDKFNTGEIKLLLGSASIREGVDLQMNSTVMYILQAEYNPTTAMQLEGRLWRQGNRWANVRIVYVLAYNSIDTFIYSKLNTKISSVRGLMESGKCDLNETQQFNLDPGEIQLALTTDSSQLATLKWQTMEKELQGKLAEENQKISLLNLVKEKYKTVEKIYADFLPRINQLSKKLEAVKLEDLKEEIRKKLQDTGKEKEDKKELEKKKEEKQKGGNIYQEGGDPTSADDTGNVNNTNNNTNTNLPEDTGATDVTGITGKKKTKTEIEKEEREQRAKERESQKMALENQINKLIKNGTYPKKYEHVEMTQTTSYKMFVTKLDYIKTNYRQASAWESKKAQYELELKTKEDEDLKRWLELGLTPEQVEKEKELRDKRIAEDKPKQQVYSEELKAVGYKSYVEFEGTATLFIEGGQFDVIMSTYNGELVSKGLQLADADDIVEKLKQGASDIAGTINAKDKQIGMLKIEYDKILEERKKKGAFSLDNQIEAFKTTNNLILLKSEVAK